MGCNCGQKRQTATQPRRLGTGGSTQSFALVKSNGTTQTFGSRLEADAENARSGYTGVVKPV